MTKYWIGVASRDHVSIGVKGGFCQLCHGKKAPLSRMNKGDKILYYAPKEALKSSIPCQKIVAAGRLVDDLVYEFEMFPGFIPFRRNVAFESGLKDVPLEQLRHFEEWEENRSKLRFGHFEISEDLYNLIHDQMKN